MKKIKQFKLPPDSASVVLVCVVWNELLLLQFFIDHYKTVGVEHFIFIDNNSDDGTTEYLISRDDVNIELYAERGSYRDAKFGICLLYTSPSPRDRQKSRMPSSA